MRFLRQNVNND